MKTLIKIIPLLLVCIQCFCVSCKDSSEVPSVSANGEPIHRFALVDPQNNTKRLECVIDHVNKVIEGHVMNGFDISNFVMDFELAPGVEPLTPKGLPMPANGVFVMRSEFDNADFKYSIKISNEVSIAKFQLYNEQDTIDFSIDHTNNTLNAYFPANMKVDQFKVTYVLGNGISCNVPLGAVLTSDDQKIVVSQGELFQSTYSLKLLKIDPVDFDPFSANVYSAASGFAFKPKDFTIDKNARLVTANVEVGGNRADLETAWNNFETYGKGLELLFPKEAQLDLLRNRVKITKVDPATKTVEYNVEYGFRFSQRKWTYRYTFKNTIPYTDVAYFSNHGFQYTPEYVALVIGHRRYLAVVPAKANSSSTKRNFYFYQSANPCYNLDYRIDSPVAISGAYRALIPSDADLSKAHLEFTSAKNYNLSVDKASYESLPELTSIAYRNMGVPILFVNPDASNSSYLSWKIYINTVSGKN